MAREVGAAMWGGRRLPSEQRRELVAADDQGPTVAERVRDGFGFALVVAGVPVAAAGAGLLWGAGAAVLLVGLAMVAVGVLLGMGQ